MNQNKIISKILYYICCTLSAGYLVTAVYSILCLITGFAITPYKQNLYLHINYPFTETPFLNIENNYPYIIFSFYDRPYLLWYIFSGFRQRFSEYLFNQSFFTKENISELRRFYIYNIFFPLPVAILASFFVEVESIVWGLVFIHFMLGIFCLFLANIFSQGLHLQNEQDLFI